MIDRSIIGFASGPFVVPLERGRLQFFAKVIGLTDPVYTDVAAARAKGYPDVLVPPTFVFGLEIETGDAFATFEKAKIDLGEVLHGEQEFVFHKPLFAGQTVSLSTKVTDVYAKKNGQLEFLVRETTVTRDGERALDLRSITAVAHK
jgi:acyl dehydratase